MPDNNENTVTLELTQYEVGALYQALTTRVERLISGGVTPSEHTILLLNKINELYYG